MVTAQGTVGDCTGVGRGRAGCPEGWYLWAIAMGDCDGGGGGGGGSGGGGGGGGQEPHIYISDLASVDLPPAGLRCVAVGNMGSDYGVKLLPADWVGRPDYFGDTTVADPGMVQKLGPVPDGNVLGRLSEYSSSFKDGPTFVQRAGQSHTWESVFMSEDSFGELLAVAQAAKDTDAAADVGAVVPNARPDVSEQQNTVDLTDDPSPKTAAAAELVRDLSGASGASRASGTRAGAASWTSLHGQVYR